MHDSRTIANRFLALAAADGSALTPMQLLKLVYIAHGWSLGLTGRPLIKDTVEAWQYGPVLPRLYESIRHYRGAPVTDSLPAPLARDELTEDEERFLGDVYRRYGQKDGLELSRLTHAPGSPWSKTYDEAASFGRPIPNDLIRAYYEDLAAKP